MNIDANKVAPWLAIIAIVVGWVVMGTNLFNRVGDHEGRIIKLEEGNKERDLEQKKRDEKQIERDEELKTKLTQRDTELQTALGKISESLNFANWRIGAITDQLKEKKR